MTDLEKLLTIKQNWTGTHKAVPEEWIAEFGSTPTVGEVRRATAEVARLRAVEKAAKSLMDTFDEFGNFNYSSEYVDALAAALALVPK